MLKLYFYFRKFIQEEKTWLGDSPPDRSRCSSRPCLSSPWLQSANNSPGCKIKEHPPWQRLRGPSYRLWDCKELMCLKNTHVDLCHGHYWLHWSWVRPHFTSQWKVWCLQLRHCSAGAANWQEASGQWVQPPSLGNNFSVQKSFSSAYIALDSSSAQ